ncbi:hypothetical protein OG705_11515 [Streptomyces sp. NBC_00838]|uniref:hypothetical protein n=1 Tax=Streptomyces sp. NBC_00838 TaxID=2903680 RepID=UPI003865B97A|nr:hypothetical protein OG705_11515 [Streptomyces sp. NBC_00838]
MAGEETQYPRGRSSVPAADSPVDASAEQLLVRLHLDSPDASEVFSHPGRNNNWSGETDTNNAVFVKRLKKNPKEYLKRYQRLMAFEQLMDRGRPPFLRPEFLGGDEEQRLLVFGMLDDIRSGCEVEAEEEPERPSVGRRPDGGGDRPDSAARSAEFRLHGRTREGRTSTGTDAVMSTAGAIATAVRGRCAAP